MPPHQRLFGQPFLGYCLACQLEISISVSNFQQVCTSIAHQMTFKKHQLIHTQVSGTPIEIPPSADLAPLREKLSMALTPLTALGSQPSSLQILNPFCANKGSFGTFCLGHSISCFDQKLLWFASQFVEVKKSPPILSHNSTNAYQCITQSQLLSSNSAISQPRKSCRSENWRPKTSFKQKKLRTTEIFGSEPISLKQWKPKRDLNQWQNNNKAHFWTTKPCSDKMFKP